jgi:DNA polymerase-4
VRFDLYRAASAVVRGILTDVTPLVEPLSLDEAYLDVTALDRYAWDIAKEIRRRIFQQTGLTGSAGIAPNKMLAKIASDWRKPNGQFAITPGQVDAFMRDLPVRKIWGIGPKSAEKFAAAGITTCCDLQRFALSEMILRHGKWGEELFHLCRGEDDRPVQPNRICKSLSNECTYLENLESLDACRNALDELIGELQEELRGKAAERSIRKVFVKMKFSDFTRITRECLAVEPACETFHTLLETAWRSAEGRPVRLLGTGVRFAETSASDRPDAAQPLLDL